MPDETLEQIIARWRRKEGQLHGLSGERCCHAQCADELEAWARANLWVLSEEWSDHAALYPESKKSYAFKACARRLDALLGGRKEGAK